jgi:hypothetical protein
MPDELAERVQSALDTAIGVTSVLAREVHAEILATAIAFEDWLNDSRDSPQPREEKRG